MNWKAFGAMLARDAHVARRNAMQLLFQTFLQPLLFVFDADFPHLCAAANVQRPRGARDHAVEQRFLTAAHRAMLIVERDPDAALDRLASSPLPSVSKWMDRTAS